MSASVTAGPRPRSAVRLMFDPTFGGFFWAKVLSVAGNWTHCLVAAVVIFNATGSSFMVGLVGVAQFGPQLLFSPLSGKWADIGNPVRQMLLGRTLVVLGSGSLAIWLMAVPTPADDHLTIAVLVTSILVGMGFVVGGPALQSIVPSLVRDNELSTAMALNSVPMTVGRVAGPVAGAYLTAEIGPAAGFAVSAGLNLVFVIIVALVRFPRPQARRADVDYRIRAALRFVGRDRVLLVALIAVGTVGFTADPSITLAPSMAEELGGDTRLVGVLSAAFGAGAAVALIFLAAIGGRIAARRVATCGLWLLAAGSVVLVFSPTAAVAVAGFVLAGTGFGSSMTGLSTVVLERVPDELRGRIMSLWMAGFVGSRPAAAVVLGGAADHFGVAVSFAIAGGLTAVVVLVWQLCLRRHPDAVAAR